MTTSDRPSRSRSAPGERPSADNAGRRSSRGSTPPGSPGGHRRRDGTEARGARAEGRRGSASGRARPPASAGRGRGEDPGRRRESDQGWQSPGGSRTQRNFGRTTGQPGQTRPRRDRRGGVDPARPARHDDGARAGRGLNGPRPLPAAARGWGGVARRGAFQVDRSASEASTDAAPGWGRVPSEPPRPLDRWIRVDDEDAQTRTPRTSGPISVARVTSPHPLPSTVAAEIRAAARTATKVQRDQLVRRFEQGVAAYEAGRFDEAFRLAKLVGNRAPGIEAVDEVAGLAAYRLGRWREATRYLEGYIERSGDQDQIPVLMDCYRGLGRTAKVGGLWRDLRRLSPGREVLAEARIVAAGALADSGDLSGAISILSAGAVTRSLRNPAGRHLRQWYALADLYERAGDVPRARELFARVARADPEAFDVQSRLQSLGGGPRRTARSAGRR